MSAYQTTKDQLVVDIAAAGTATDKLLLSQALVEVSSAEVVDVVDYNERLTVVESSKTQSNRLVGKRVPQGFRNTAHMLYSRGTDESFIFMISTSGTTRCLFSPDGGDNWYWWDFNLSRDNYTYDVIVDETNGTFKLFWKSANIIYESSWISYTDMIATGFVPEITTGTAVTTNTAKGSYFGVGYHVDGHMFLVYSTISSANARDICSMTKPDGGVWGAEVVRLAHQWDGATTYFHEDIKTRILPNVANTNFYFGSDAASSTTANYARFGVFKVVWNGLDDFTFTRLGMDSLNAAPYYLGTYCSLYLINDANDSNKEKLVFIPTNDGNSLDNVYLVNTDTFSAFVNTGIAITQDPNTYVHFPLPNGQYIRNDWYYTKDWGVNWQTIGYNHANWQINTYPQLTAGRFRTYYGYNNEYKIIDLNTFKR